MKRQYNGLEAMKIQLTNDNVITTSTCPGMIQLQIENNVCVSPEWMQQIEYVGDQG